jgi:hypothetical protein
MIRAEHSQGRRGHDDFLDWAKQTRKPIFNSFFSVDRLVSLTVYAVRVRVFIRFFSINS